MPSEVQAIVESKAEKKERRRVLILGLGNILLRDEGFGVHVAQQLAQTELPDYVEVIDGGTSSLDVLLGEEGVKKLIVVDVLKAGGEPGAIYRLKVDSDHIKRLKELFGPHQRATVSLHQIGLIDALAAAEKLGNAPQEIVIIGIEPKEIEWKLELTDVLKKQVTQVINLVLEEV
ncbi:MAG: hypothetical protein AMJ79_13160 [Phycisphaerae bacterium SM23_30]|nr:MAG: hypothetical protein AMJ79_13160 [Phycisphaerae bacterium SM23_30]